MKQEISFVERRKIQLDMLDEIDTFCRSNNIRYSIAFGTLLGAIRHKGFIPWDDDVDIMMPLPDLLRFKKTFKSNTMKYVDVDVDAKHGFAFSRVVHTRTYNYEGKSSKTYGICIDLYIILGIDNTDRFFNNINELSKKRLFMLKWRSRAIRRLPINNIPLFNYYTRKYRDYFFANSISYEEAKIFYIIAGPLNLKERMIYSRDIFAKMIDVNFEDKVYMAIADWDYFLTLRYGDYMQLPPEDQRHPYHGGHYYWK